MFKKILTLRKILFSVSLSLLLFNVTAASPKISDQKYIQDFPLTLEGNFSQTYLSEPVETVKPFTAVDFNWEADNPDGTSVKLEVRVKTQKDENWTNWYEIEKDDDITDDEDPDIASGFLATNLSTEYQYKVTLKTFNEKISPKLLNIEVLPINPEDGGNSNASFLSSVLNYKKFLVANIPDDNLDIITRTEWGADESLRYNYDVDESEDAGEEEEPLKAYDDGTKILFKVDETNQGDKYEWPLEYSNKIKKIIVHHTASTKDLDDPKTAIQNIYYYHSERRGWGDIGYNYIIDPEGNIYEGRAGGEKVVAGHAADYNVGSIGIAVLGDYENSELPGPVVDALLRLIQEKVELHNIDPDGTSIFRGDDIPNIIGHRDVTNTACPGDYIYNKLQEIKKLIANSLDNSPNVNKKYDYLELGQEDLILILGPEDTNTATVKIKNKGKNAWDEDTYLMYDFTNANDQSAITLDTISDEKLAYIDGPVAKNETGTFTFDVEANLESGLYVVDLYPVFNGKVKASRPISYPIYVEQIDGTYDIVEIVPPETVLRPGETTRAEITLKNKSNFTWYQNGDNRVTLGAVDPKGRTSLFFDEDSTEAGILKEKKVEVGETGTFIMNFTAPSEDGVFNESFMPVAKSEIWLDGEEINFEMQVINKQYKALLTDQSEEEYFEQGETKEIWFELKNIGTETWKEKGKNKFSTAVIKNIALEVTDTKISKKIIQPGSSVKLKTSITAPNEDGMYYSYFIPRVNNKKLFEKPIKYVVTVGEETALGLSTDSTTRAGNLQKENNDIRILISDAEGYKHTISADSSFSVYADGKKLYTFPKNSEVNVTHSYNKYHLTSDDFSFDSTVYYQFVPNNGGIMEVVNYENRPAWNEDYNDNRFRGTIEVRKVDDELVVINELPIEDYLRGLGELGPDDPVEKHKAIMVAARTYAKYYTDLDEKFPGKPYHLDDDPAISQKYNGYSMEMRSSYTVNAAEETYGEVVTYDGELIKTPYFSQSDGRTRSAEEVFGWTHTPYLQSVDDPYCEGLEMRGHGVGLSGCGSKGAAENGKTYLEILKYYYLGVEIETIY